MTTRTSAVALLRTILIRSTHFYLRDLNRQPKKHLKRSRTEKGHFNIFSSTLAGFTFNPWCKNVYYSAIYQQKKILISNKEEQFPVLAEIRRPFALFSLLRRPNKSGIRVLSIHDRNIILSKRTVKSLSKWCHSVTWAFKLCSWFNLLLPSLKWAVIYGLRRYCRSKTISGNGSQRCISNEAINALCYLLLLQFDRAFWIS